MADLERNDPTTRDAWEAFAHELNRRGLRPKGDITVHGPHAPPANQIWGQAEATTRSGWGCEVRFETPPDAGIDELEVWMDDAGERHVFLVLEECEPHEERASAGETPYASPSTGRWERDLRRAGVELVDRQPVSLRCVACRRAWSPTMSGGRMRRDSRHCPAGCNSKRLSHRSSRS